MKKLTKISLNKNWQYCIADMSEDFSSPQLDDSDWVYAPSIDFNLLMHASSDRVWLRKRFDLSPTDVCVRYFLRCAGCSVPMTIYLRGQVMLTGRADEALDVDITDYISLDDNVLVLAITPPAETRFGAQGVDVYLQPIACDDLA